MPTYLAPGVYVEEVDKGPKPIEAVATAVAGFVGIAARGPLNRPIAVNSWSDYVRVFGGFAKDSMMSYAAFGYFNNGGQNAYVVRVANSATMARAKAILSYRPVGRTAAYTLDGPSLAVGATTAKLTVAAGLPVGTRLQIKAGTDTQIVTVTAVDGATKTITFGPALGVAYAAPTITVQPSSLFPTGYKLAAAALAAASTVQVTDARGLAVGDRIALWETAAAPETLVISAIAADGTLTLAAALANAYTTGALVAPNPGLQLMAAKDPVTVTGGSASAQTDGKGSWGNDIEVRVDESALVQTALTATAAAGATEATLKSVRGIAVGSLLRFYNRATQVEEYRVVTKLYPDVNKVEWSGGLAGSYPAADTDMATVEFRLTARHRWSGVQEVFDGLSMESGYTSRYAVTVLNNDQGEAKASGLVEATNLIHASWTDVTLQHKVPQAMKKGTWLRLQGGRNGSDSITVNDFKGQNLGPDNRTGLAALEAVDQVTMLICADAVGYREDGTTALFSATDTQALHLGLLEHAGLMLDRFAIIDCRKGLDLQAVQEQRENLESKYGAMYYPWIYVDNPLDASGKQLLVPPSGHIAGLYARIDQQRGVHKAPANEVLFGARNLEYQISMAEQNLLNPLGINCIRKFPGRGIRVWGARTLSGDPSWRYINVRRLFLQIEESVEEGTQWTVFEPNDETLWAKIRRDVGAFLYRFYLQGAFFGTSPEEAYFVKCDAETNPPEVIDAGQVMIEIGIAPVKPAEFVIFRVGQKPTGGSVSE